VTGDYTIAALCAPVAVVAAELTALRTGLLRRPRFWVTIAITLAFQVAVDGWLTKLSAPIVLYRRLAISGARWPWDIPVEDFGFAFAMITLTLALWERALRRERELRRERDDPAAAPGHPGGPQS
jgi:lycopene cyclase domain-containing protein